MKFAIVVESGTKAPFLIVTTPWCNGGRYSFPRIAPLYRIVLRVKQEGINIIFWVFESNWDWTSFSWGIGEHSTHENQWAG